MSTGKKWLVGCGIGCGTLILIVAALIAGGVGFFRGIVSDLEESGRSQARLDAELGAMADYTPPRDGAIPTDRLEVFLAVRTRLQPWHLALTEYLSAFPPADAGPTRIGAMQQVRITTGMGRFLRDLGAYLRLRNETLLEHEMGLGEYFYIHALVYHWWLGHNPIDGPELLYGLEHEDGVNIRFFDDDTNFGKTRSSRLYHETARQMLERQLAAVDADPGGLPEGWRDVLAAEVAALDADLERMPWQDGLPAQMTGGLEALRDRLENTYCPVTNVFDLHDAEGGGP